ncbi:hypothetical protein GCM10025772_12090 [Ferrimonas gelatinilytica]|uniref:HNH nuclease domain-containing protein n=1 Tax=Ferrimonas gelatinilytica TaxID=1255257 RepID=A0ABP9S0V1_9GAMM
MYAGGLKMTRCSGEKPVQMAFDVLEHQSKPNALLDSVYSWRPDGGRRTRAIEAELVVEPVPDELDPLSDINNASDLPSDETERETVVKARLGQGRFRRDMLSLWGGCAVTGVVSPLMLRASHAKPWRISDNAERLDANNGLALTPSLDAAFDSGWITFNDSGEIVISSRFPSDEALKLEIRPNLKLRKPLNEKQKLYMAHHREEVFLGP